MAVPSTARVRPAEAPRAFDPGDLTLEDGVYANLAHHEPGQADGHVESWFLKLNDPEADRALWVRFTCLVPEGKPDEAVAQAWAIWFDATGSEPEVHAVRQTHPIGEARLGRKRFSVRIGGCLLEDDRTDGLCWDDDHAIGWDLVFTVDRAPYFPFPHGWMYTGPFPKTKATTPHPASWFTGRIRVDGRTIEVREWPGCQGHNWGRGHAQTYGWVQCSAFDGAPGTWFEAMAGRVKVAGLTLPTLSMARLHHEGRVYDLTRLRDLRSTAEIGDGPRFVYEGRRRGEFTIRAEVGAPRELLATLPYDDPDGAGATCWNSMLASARVQLRSPRGPVELVARRRACLEILDRTDRFGLEPLL